jgi:hypothetical protein
LQQRDMAMPLDLKDPKSGMDYFQAATLFAKYANSGTLPDQIPNIPYWENLFPSAAGITGTYCNGPTTTAAPTATQSMYEMFQCNWGASTLGASNFINVFDTNCQPSCLQLPGQPAGGVPFQFYNAQFSALYAWSSIGTSAYNAAQLVLRSRPTHGLQFDFNYTFSRSIDEGSDAERVGAFGGLSAIINTWDPKQLRGLSDFDATHQINANWVYDLPFGNGKRFGHDWNRLAESALGGWQISGIYRWTSGFPFTVPAGQTWNTNFQLGGNAVVVGTAPKSGVFYNSNGDPFAFDLGSDPVAFANAHFRLPYPGESGPRNNFRGPGFFGVDLGINKSFRITERHSLRFSANAYNLTNSVRFDPATITFNGALTNPSSLGQYSGTLTKPRVMEFALRYQF